MADATLRPQSKSSALDGLDLPAMAGVAKLVEAPIAARFLLRAPAEVAGRMLATAGLEAPAGINRAARTSAGACLQLGPDEWLVLADAASEQVIAAMAHAADGAPHSQVQVADRSVALILDGPRVEDVLAAGCPLPLDIEAFPLGRATRTIFAKAPIVLWRQEPHRFQIEVARSFAPYLVASLAQAIATEAAFLASKPA